MGGETRPRAGCRLPPGQALTGCNVATCTEGEWIGRNKFSFIVLFFSSSDVGIVDSQFFLTKKWLLVPGLVCDFFALH